MIKNCLFCNKEFKTIPAKVIVGRGKYCCKKCYWESKKGKPTWNKGTAKFDQKSYMKVWQKTHKEWISNYRKEWLVLNPDKKEKFYLYKQEWRKKHPENEKLTQERRKANLLGAKINDFTVNQWVELLELFNSCCAYCGGYFSNLTQDHIIPLSRGGNHTKENIVPACISCNCRKNDLVLSTDTKTNYKLFKIYLNNENKQN